MANRWKGNIIAASATTSSGTNFTGKANGAWGLNSQLQQKYAGLWAKGVYPPTAPTSVAATGGNAQASISFTGSSDSGGGTITSYTATSYPSGITASASSSPIVVTGLTNGTAYTFTVCANSSLGYKSAESSPSNSVTPSAEGVLIVGSISTPFIYAYLFSVNGFGSKFANPAVLPSGYSNGLAFAPDGSAISMAVTSATPYINNYSWSAGFGTKYANPSTLPTGAGNGVSFTPSSDAVAVAHGASPFVTAYPWNAGFGTKYANPAVLPGGSGNAVSFSPTGTTVAIANYNGAGQSVCAYSWSSGFGTKYASPATLPGSTTGSDIKFSPDGNSLLLALDTGANIAAYAWNAGFGTKYANPSSLPGASGLGVAFSADGTTAVVTSYDVPRLNAYPWNNGFGTKYAAPSTDVTSAVWDVSFFGNNVVAFSLNDTPFVAAYLWNNGFSTKLADPTTLPSNSSQSLVFKP